MVKTEQNRSVAKTFIIFCMAPFFIILSRPHCMAGSFIHQSRLLRVASSFSSFHPIRLPGSFFILFLSIFGVSALFWRFRASHYVTTLITLKKSKTPFSCPMPLSEVVVCPCRFVCRSRCCRSRRCLRLRRHQHIEVNWSGKLK